MSSHYWEETFEHKGYSFVARFYHDPNFGAPWEEHDGHGPVTDWTTRNKLPGERVLVSDRHWFKYYDWQEAMRIAKRDGWNAPPYEEGSKGQKAARAVQRDFEYLRGWCDGAWHWCGISVTLANEDGEFDEGQEYDFATWGVESEGDEHHKMIMQDLADEALAEHAVILEDSAREAEASRPDMYQLA
jgi:hypothetical protein